MTLNGAEMLLWKTQEIHKALEAYAEHLQQDVPNTVQWAMIERKIIDAIQKAEHVKDHPYEEICKHEWVERLDGYEEMCVPAICRLCGKYGCGCKAEWGEMSDKQKTNFHRHGINGDDHELEKWLKEKPGVEACVHPDLRRHIGCGDCNVEPCSARTGQCENTKE